MATSFSKDFIESVRDAGDIVRLVADYVPLKGAGLRMKGLCPFHQEKTPSFSVDAERQLFYCFGCQAGGDIFKFVQLYENIGFGDAVRRLAEQFGVPLPVEGDRSPAKEDPSKQVLELNDATRVFFEKMLTDSEAGKTCREYLASRGLSEQTIERLSIGCAPDSWDSLSTHLKTKRARPQQLIVAGLALARKSGVGEYDRFRNRLMFPIRDVYGRTVAFGGRTLGDDVAKYMNSPETPAYTKGDHLYGLDAGREAIRREGFAVVVEGYMDLAALVQAGFENVVATLGTAFTEKQARLLARFTQRVTLSYDGDSAGAQATERSVGLLQERGFKVSVVPLPEGQDPDDFLRSEGAEVYGRLLRRAPDWIQFIVEREAKRRDLEQPEAKTEVLEAVLPHVMRLPTAVERADWTGRVADWLGVEDRYVRQELELAVDEQRSQLRRRAPGRPEGMRTQVTSEQVAEVERRLLYLCLKGTDARDAVRENFDEYGLRQLRIRPLLEAILECDGRGRAIDATAVLEQLSEESDQTLFTRLALADEPEEGSDISDCLWTLKRTHLADQSRKETRRLQRVQRHGEDAASGEEQAVSQTEGVDDMLRRVQELARQRDVLTDG